MRRLLAAALLATLLLGTAAAWLWSEARDHDARAQLAAAIGSAMPFEARLHGGFAPPAAPIRAAAGAPTTLPADARIAVAELEKGASDGNSPAAMVDLGVAYLIQGEVDRAIALLSDAAGQWEDSRPWSDLAAAYLVKADRYPPRRFEYLSRALDTAAHSLQLQHTQEASYNRALALERLAPYVGEPAPWAEYLRGEPDERWIRAVERRLAEQAREPDARERWEVSRRALRTALTAGDQSVVRTTVFEFPEACLEVLDQEILVEWAEALRRGDRDTAGVMLGQAELVAEARQAVTGDRMALDQVKKLSSANPALAGAHLNYAAGLQAFDGNDYGRAKNAFQSALAGFDTAQAPYRHWAAVQLATIAFQQRDLVGADRHLLAVETVAKARGYRTLRGRTLWMRGLVLSKQWQLTDALVAFKAAAHEYEVSQQHEPAVSLYHHVADALRTLGDQQESWEYMGRTLSGLDRVRKPLRRYLLLYNASLFALGQDLFETALLFQNAALNQARNIAKEVVLEATLQRAQIHLQRDDRAGARNDLTDARALLSQLPDGYVKTTLEPEAVVLGAQLADPPTTADDMSVRKAVAFLQKYEPGRVPRLYLTLAQTQLAAGDLAGGEQSLAQGIAELERQQSSLTDESLKISYFDEQWNLFDEMVTLQLSERRNPSRAFEFAERSRARALLASAEETTVSRPRSLAEIQKALPSTTTIVSYAVLPTKLLIWVISADDFMFAERGVSRDEINRLVRRQRGALTSDFSRGSVNDELFTHLIAPAAPFLAGAKTVVFAADADLQQLPFATLRNPRTGRYLIEDHAIVSTPSASFFAAATLRMRSQSPSRYDTAFLVGNPDATLPGATSEVVTAARLYSRHEIVIGNQATKDRFLARASDYEVIHFGGHAFANPEYPLLSRLEFAPAAGDQPTPLFAYEVANTRFTHTRLVILAACSTAIGNISRGEGAVSVARPFLGGGVPMVIASQWDVDDDATEKLFSIFHRVLVETKDPARALREAQLTLLRDRNGEYTSPRSWGAFVALGTTTS